MEDKLAASYERQAAHGASPELPSRFAAPGSVDNWRHDRMLSCVKPLVRMLPAARWLTVGDGSYGADAAYLQSCGVEVVASSLNADSLKIAAQRGYIRKYQQENAERLSLGDEEVDFVLCKLAFHHFPRPPIALYEMLRVARRGLVLIEPLEGGACSTACVTW